MTVNMPHFGAIYDVYARTHNNQSAHQI